MEADGDDDIWSYYTSSLLCMHTDCDCCQCIFKSLNRNMLFMDAPIMRSMTIIVTLPKTAAETLCIQLSLWTLMLFAPRHIQSNFCSACVWCSEMVESLADKFQGSGVEKMYFRMRTLFTGCFSPVGLVCSKVCCLSTGTKTALLLSIMPVIIFIMLNLDRNSVFSQSSI